MTFEPDTLLIIERPGVNVAGFFQGFEELEGEKRIVIKLNRGNYAGDICMIPLEGSIITQTSELTMEAVSERLEAAARQARLSGN